MEPAESGVAWLNEPNDPSEAFDCADFTWDYTGFESVAPEDDPLALSPPPPAQEDIWPQIRRHIDDHRTRERDSGTFPSSVFRRRDSLRLWLKETFAGLSEETFQIALDYVTGLLE